MSPETSAPESPDAAREIINREGRRHTLVVYFVKKDGRERRMVCRYFGTTSRKAHLMVVWDIERGAERSVNLETVRLVKILQPRQDRPALPPRREMPAAAPKSAAEREEARLRVDVLKAEMAEMF